MKLAQYQRPCFKHLAAWLFPHAARASVVTVAAVMHLLESFPEHHHDLGTAHAVHPGDLAAWHSHSVTLARLSLNCIRAGIWTG
jgi:hypothetical protein